MNFKDQKYDDFNERKRDSMGRESKHSYHSRERQEEARDPKDVPDVKTLHQRYEHLMNTITEHAKEDSVTEVSHTGSNDDLSRAKKVLNQAKTMKWKKGDKMVE